MHPNKQNERYWGEVDPKVEVDCKVQGGKKVMCWAAVINGQIITHWFPFYSSVNHHVYLDMLETVLWPAVKGVSARRQYWFQKDRATSYTTHMDREWLSSKFGPRVISRHTDIPWPARSPDMSPLDFWFWSVCLEELRRSPPSTLDELQEIVTDYADSIDKAARDIIVRAKACKAALGGPFEYNNCED